MVEVQPQGLERVHRRVIPLHDLRPVDAVGQRRLIVQVAVHHHVLYRWQGGAQFIHHGVALQVFTAVCHAVDRYQHLGCDLLEPIDHRIGAHVGCAHTPNAANADDRQKRHHGFRNIRQVRRHPVTGLHALRLQVQSQHRRLAF